MKKMTYTKINTNLENHEYIDTKATLENENNYYSFLKIWKKYTYLNRSFLDNSFLFSLPDIFQTLDKISFKRNQFLFANEEKEILINTTSFFVNVLNESIIDEEVTKTINRYFHSFKVNFLNEGKARVAYSVFKGFLGSIKKRYVYLTNKYDFFKFIGNQRNFKIFVKNVLKGKISNLKIEKFIRSYVSSANQMGFSFGTMRSFLKKLSPQKIYTFGMLVDLLTKINHVIQTSYKNVGRKVEIYKSIKLESVRYETPDIKSRSLDFLIEEINKQNKNIQILNSGEVHKEVTLGKKLNLNQFYWDYYRFMNQNSLYIKYVKTNNVIDDLAEIETFKNSTLPFIEEILNHYGLKISYPNNIWMSINERNYVEFANNVESHIDSENVSTFPELSIPFLVALNEKEADISAFLRRAMFLKSNSEKTNDTNSKLMNLNKIYEEFWRGSNNKKINENFFNFISIVTPQVYLNARKTFILLNTNACNKNITKDQIFSNEKNKLDSIFHANEKLSQNARSETFWTSQKEWTLHYNQNFIKSYLHFILFKLRFMRNVAIHNKLNFSVYNRNKISVLEQFISLFIENIILYLQLDRSPNYNNLIEWCLEQEFLLNLKQNAFLVTLNKNGL